ncbi:MAG: hypothetical protein KA712_14615 [Myxococcales bacterium]|nr:hypothetical protein [Myxococcales bacterium]
MLSAKAVILYGNGGDLGNLEVFARGIQKSLPESYGHKDVIVKNVIRKEDFFHLIDTFANTYVGSITELHIVSHAIGAGLFLGYHVAAINDSRWSVQLEIQEKKKRRISYDEVVATEIGAVLTDDFVRPAIKAKAAAMRSAFAVGSTIKIWGCNSGVDGWLYGDNGEADPNVYDERIPYYWRALNTRNVPKPAIAQAFADFFSKGDLRSDIRRACRGLTPWQMDQVRAISRRSE